MCWVKGQPNGMIVKSIQSCRRRSTTMGFADLSIAEIAEDYHLPPQEVLQLCDRLGIAYRDLQTRLPLEDAKAVMLEILNQRQAKQD
jgi:predicted DNA-binding protein YlxM (UPF0122 family)